MTIEPSGSSDEWTDHGALDRMFRSSRFFHRAFARYLARSGKLRKPGSFHGRNLAQTRTNLYDQLVRLEADPEVVSNFLHSEGYLATWRWFMENEKRLRRTLSRQMIREMSFASLDNARQLFEAAQSLKRDGYFGFTGSLMVACYEEVGKTLLFAGSAAQNRCLTELQRLGLMEGIRTARLKRSGRFLHTGKGKATDLVIGAWPGGPLENLMVIQLQAVLAGWLRRAGSGELESFLRSPNDAAAREAAVSSLADALRRKPPWIAAPLALIAGGRTDLAGDGKERLRQRGLYTDLTDNGILRPSDISAKELTSLEEDARSAVEAAQVFVEARSQDFSLLISLIPDLLDAAGPLRFPLLGRSDSFIDLSL